MLRQKSILYTILAIVGDILIVWISLALGVLAIQIFYGLDVNDQNFRVIASAFLFLCPLVTIFSFYIAKIYDALRLKSYVEIFLSLVQGTAMSVVVLTAFTSVVDSSALGLIQGAQDIHLRKLVVAFGVVCFVLMMAQRAGVKMWLGHRRSTSRNIRRILIVGTGEKARRLDGVIDFHKHWGLYVVGFLTLGGAKVKESGLVPKADALNDERVIGDVSNIGDIIDEYIVDEVVFAVTLSEAKYLDEAIAKCEEVGLTFHLIADFLDTTISRVDVDRIGTLPMLTFSSAPQNFSAMAIKRAMDIVVSGGMLLATAIVTVPVAIAIKLTSKGPLFFKQKRVGLNGRVFTLYKFRSMVTGAEKMQADLMEQNEMSGPVFKIQKDPRITKIGAFIRKWSIDELPQLLNIFMGHMSVVGPRPLPTYEVEKFVRWQRRRLSMKPGLTCIWQIEGRSTITDFDDWMKLDLQYIDNWSLGLDIKILLKTAPAVLFSKGAH